MKLLLFDIDGTLLISRGSGRRAMKKTVRRLTGKRDVDTSSIDFSGRTDPQIIREVFLCNGMTEEQVDAILPDALQIYIEHFESDFSPDQFETLPGVHELIEALHELPGVQLALLTGNLERTGYLKLRGIDMDGYFPFGAFGSDHADRYQLPQIAVDRALSHTGNKFEGKNIVIIGDTRHDILCGRSMNVFSIAVSTGHYSSEDLHVHGPDALLENLSDTTGFVEMLV